MVRVTSARVTATTRDQYELVERGTLQVNVARPWSNIPEGLVSYSSYGQERKQWDTPRREAQLINVDFELYRDVPQLADLVRRSTVNRSGTAVRGLARAEGGRLVTEGITRKVVGQLVARAANASSHKAIEGPLSARVKLREQPQPLEAHCRRCGQLPSEHDVEVEPHKGKWVGGRTRDAHYDPEADNPWTRYFCREAQA